jgi:hypothetical protein
MKPEGFNAIIIRGPRYDAWQRTLNAAQRIFDDTIITYVRDAEPEIYASAQRTHDEMQRSLMLPATPIGAQLLLDAMWEEFGE